MELKIDAGDQSEVRKLNFTWAVRDYTENNIWIQILFDNPPRVSEHIEEEDKLAVYFWGNDKGFFKG